MLVVLALAVNVSAARAVVAVGSNTITWTAITSPSDPSYLYDPADGAVNSAGDTYGGFAVTGTTNSTDPSSDAVDIDCYSDDGNTGTYEYTVASDVSLNASGGFSTTVPYASLEQNAGSSSPDATACRLRALPAGDEPASGLGSFSGPRVLLAYLAMSYENDYGESGIVSTAYDYSLVAPELGVTDAYSSAGECGLSGAYLNDQSVFGQIDGQSFSCAAAHTFWPYLYGYGSDLAAGVKVDGADAYTPAAQHNIQYSVTSPLTVSVSQDSANGDMTIVETDPLVVCADANCDSYSDAGVEEDRTIRQADSGHVVEVTDSFRSTDGAAHSVAVNVMSQQCFLAATCGDDLFDPTQVGYEFPGEATFTTHASGDQVTVGSQSPASIYVQGTSADIAGAITYFTPPSGPFSFLNQNSGGSVPFYFSNSLIAPYDLSVPAGGSTQLSYAYSTETGQDGLARDIPTALDLQTPPTITITSPAAGAGTTSASATVTGTLAAVTGVASVTVNGVPATVDGSGYRATVPLTPGANTLTAIETTSSGITASATEIVTYDPSTPGTPAKTPVPTTTTTTTTTPATTPITPAITGFAGATWLPIADTGGAHRAGTRREALHGKVTAGSGAVTYYFQYGKRGHHLNHRTKAVALAASKTSRGVVLTIGGLSRGTRYAYRLVATGQYGHATGRTRSFKASAGTK